MDTPISTVVPAAGFGLKNTLGTVKITSLPAARLQPLASVMVSVRDVELMVPTAPLQLRSPVTATRPLAGVTGAKMLTLGIGLVLVTVSVTVPPEATAVLGLNEMVMLGWSLVRRLLSVTLREVTWCPTVHKTDQIIVMAMESGFQSHTLNCLSSNL